MWWCDFCQIDMGKLVDYDIDELCCVVESVLCMNLCYVIVMSVVCDDFFDIGVWFNVEMVWKIYEFNLNIGVELFVNEYNVDLVFLGQIFDVCFEVFVYNVEIVLCIFKCICFVFCYECFLNVLMQVCDVGFIIKLNFILGMGEELEEVVQVLQDFYDVGCDIIIIMQYLWLMLWYYLVLCWVKFVEFVEFKEEVECIGFFGVFVGLLVCFLYCVGWFWVQFMVFKGCEIFVYLVYIVDSVDFGFVQVV